MASLLPSISSDEEDNAKNKKTIEEDDDSSDDEVNKDFEFGGILGEDGGFQRPAASGWSYQSALDILEENDAKALSSVVPRMDVASIIAAKRKHLKSSTKRVTDEEHNAKDSEEENESGSEADSESNSDSKSDDDSDDSSSSDDEEEVDDAEVAMEGDTLKTRAGQEEKQDDESDDSDDEDEDKEEKTKAAAYFDSTASQADNDIEVFSQLTLSRPLLRGVAAMGFVRPTPIQAAVIPVALAGRDVCASAVTGSGKTAAFLLPILERLFHRAAGGTRAIILTPTRELAAQCLGMLTTIAQFTKIRACLVVGGAKNVNAQAAELRTRPDVIVATPGRLLDHVTNSQGVTLDDVEFLILDEADRLLDLGFQDEVHEIIRSCPVERQTLLFSATMTTKVDDLIKLSLKRPVRIKVSDNKSKSEVEVAPRLEQEFVRIRAGNEGINREGMLLALLTRTFTNRTIVFFDTKSAAHRLMILCGLCGIKCAELHGNLTQTQRLSALEDFRKSEVDVLLATDLAARGLDIDRVQTIINFEMPSQVETYIHRIGRTARAGRGGKSCTLIGEGRRHLMKDVIKDAEQKLKQAKELEGCKSGVIRSRTIPPAVVAHFVEKIRSLQDHVDEVLQAEAIAREDRIAEMEAVRAQNIIEHADEIKSRPQREWFASSKQKQSTKEAAAEKAKRIADAVGTGKHRMTRKKRRAREAREEMLQYQEEQRQEAEEKGRKGKKIVTEESMKISARAVKKRQAQAEKERLNTSIHDEDVIRERKKKQNPKKKKRKGAFAMDAAGDSGLFDEERVTHAKKTKTGGKDLTSNDGFRGHDPSMERKKKTKKKSHHAFKSKSKYKRRQ